MPDIIVEDGPLYSKVRIPMDFTEGTSATALWPMFNHSLSLIGSNGNQVKAFSYAVGDNATAAGFHQTSQITEAHTNVTRKGEVPGKGRMDITAIAFVPDGFLLKPAVINTLAGVTAATAGSHFPVKDAILGTVYSHALRAISRSFVPFVQYGDTGAKTYLGSMQLYPAGRGIFASANGAKLDGPIFKFGAPLKWNTGGQYANLLVGLELREESYMAPWAADGGVGATDPGTTFRAALGYATAGSAPSSALAVMTVADIKVVLLGRRYAAAGD